jgi:hypothetical protein
MRFPRFIPLLFLAFSAIARAQLDGVSVSSPDFAYGSSIPARFTCDGENVPPTLDITRVPTGTRSFALLVDDRDSPSGSFTHWIVWNIPPGTKRLSAGALPAGVREGTNDFGTKGYSGPAPPSGTHRYYFVIWALDTVLTLPTGASREDFDAAIRGHVKASTEVMGRYAKAGQ